MKIANPKKLDLPFRQFVESKTAEPNDPAFRVLIKYEV
jgi:hypothetical protein